MGTIADKLQAALNSKNALKTKFGLADTLPFSQYADNINSINKNEFYKCIQVESYPESCKFRLDLKLGFEDGRLGDWVYEFEPRGRYLPQEWVGTLTNSSDSYTYVTLRLRYDADNSVWKIYDFGFTPVGHLSSSSGLGEILSIADLSNKDNWVFDMNYWSKWSVVTIYVSSIGITETLAPIDNVQWSGQQITMQDGEFKLGEAVRAFSISDIIPEVGGIYTSDLKCDVAKLYPDLTGASGGGTATYYKCAEVGMLFEMPEPVFSAPLTAQSDTAETGQALTTSGTVTFQEVDGKQCATAEGLGNYITTTDEFTLGSTFTLCGWIKHITEVTTEGDYALITISESNNTSSSYGDSGHEIWILANGDDVHLANGGASGEILVDTTTNGNNWTHVAAVWDNGTWTLYVNGVSKGSASTSQNFSGYGLKLNVNSLYRAPQAVGGHGHYFDWKLFDTALNAEQVMKLYDPTYEPSEALAPNTWTGYKAFLVEDTENNKVYYDFETELTTDTLTWGKGFTPEVNGIYDAEAMIKAELTGKYPEIASPQNMTSYTQGDWVVSASSERFSDIPAYGAFGGGVWYGYDSNPWLQWQNTLQKVLIRQLSFGYGGASDKIYTCKLMGSDDGTNWIEIGTRDCVYSGDNNMTTLTFPDNETPYYYHRLYSVSDSGTAVVAGLVAKRDID